MSKIPVLLLISRDIDLNVLNQSPRFQRYHFFSLAAIDYLVTPSVGQTLQNALDGNIERVGVQYLLAHLGLAFDRYPVEFLTAVLDINLGHPRLKVALDKGLPYAIHYLKLFAPPGPEATSLLDRLIQNRSAFDTDKETAALAACMY